MKFMPRLLLLMVLCIFGEVCSAAKLNKKISVLTIAPGTELYSLFGHNAIRVQDLLTGDDLTYNYGTFDFDTPNFAIKFMRGKLPYALTKAPMQNFLTEYNQTRRGVVEQELNLDSLQTYRLIDLLETNALPENRLYMYDFLFDNCATRIRDVIEASSSKPIKYDESNFSAKSYRDQLHEYLTNYPWTKFGIDLIVASPADKATDIRTQMFLPDYVNTHFSSAVTQLDSSAIYISKPSKELLFFENEPSRPSWFNPSMIFGLLSVLIILLYFIKPTKAFAFGMCQTWFVILGISSLLIIFMWFGTDHKTTKDNFNILWISPLYMFMPFVGRKTGMIIGGILTLLTLGILVTHLPQKMPILPVLPLIVTTLGLSLYHLYRDQEVAKG